MDSARTGAGARRSHRTRPADQGAARAAWCRKMRRRRSSRRCSTSQGKVDASWSCAPRVASEHRHALRERRDELRGARIARVAEQVARRTGFDDTALRETPRRARSTRRRRSWVAISIVVPSRASWRSTSTTSTDSSGSSADVGSSHNSTCGDGASARNRDALLLAARQRAGPCVGLVRDADLFPAARARVRSRSRGQRCTVTSLPSRSARRSDAETAGSSGTPCRSGAAPRTRRRAPAAAPARSRCVRRRPSACPPRALRAGSRNAAACSCRCRTADQRRHAAGLQREVDPVQHAMRAERLVDAFEPDHRHSAWNSAWRPKRVSRRRCSVDSTELSSR